MMVLPHLLLYLLAWGYGVTGFVFTNSFDNWVGNTTYRVDWDTSSSDPSIYDLELVQPGGVYSIGVTPNISWPDRWSHKYAVQIPINGDHFIQVSLGSDVWPGAYYWRMKSPNQTTAVSNMFLISSSSGSTNPTTITSLVPVTATQDVVQTSDGHTVTYKSSDVYSSAIIYTTIIVVSDGGKGTPLAKLPMIIGIVLALVFLITLPVILWLVLRYRRRPTPPSGGGKPVPMDVEGIHNSSVLDLVPSNASVIGSTAASVLSTRSTTRQVWTIVDGEKRLVTISQDHPRSTTPVGNSDPFADPLTPISPKSTRRILIPTNPSTSDHDSPLNNTNPYDPLLSRTNTTNSAMLLRGADIHTGSSRSEEYPREKMSQQARQMLHSEQYALSEEDITSRIVVPGRAVDMGPLGRDYGRDVDENGLLPPDYFQATQPLSPRQSSQAGPSNL